MKRIKLVGPLGALMLLLAFAAGPVSATHVDPVFFPGPGNITCIDALLALDPTLDPDDVIEVKIDPPANGVFPAGNAPGFVEISNLNTSTDPATFDWSSNLEILAVIAKGGPGANVYYYNPPPTFEDEGLEFAQGSSHISFCFTDPNVPQGEPLDVEKDADGTSELKYTWLIDKAVDQTSQTGTPPGTVTFNYTVTVSHDAGVESGFAVTGTITVTNANAYDVTGVDITDELDDGTVCTVTGGTDATIPANDSADFAYSCSPADDSATENTVTVDWPDQAGPPFLPAGTAPFVAAIDWTQDVIDECIDVTDTNVALPLGSVCVGDANPTIFNYSLDVDIPQTGCIEVDNTAEFTTTDTDTTGDDSVTVQVCSTFEGCTPGYWKQSQHFDSWTGYTPNQLVSTVFANAGALGNNTLLQALGFNGGNNLAGAKQILLRAGVAALLNSTSAGTDYKYTTAEVIAAVNGALASTSRSAILAVAADLDMHNNAGCDLN